MLMKCFYILLFVLVVKADAIKKAKMRKNVTSAEDTLAHNFNLPIVDVLQKHAHGKEEDLYEKNLFALSKQFTGVDQKRISNGFMYTPALNQYILKHSYLEVQWCFKLFKEMTFYKTFDKIKTMSSNNQFVVYSATGKKQWPSGNKTRHEVCDEISKQPITSGLYEKFLEPSRAMYFHMSVAEFTKIKELVGINKLAVRLEFAHALKIESVEKKIKPKIIKAIETKLKAMTFESIELRDNRLNGNHGNAPSEHYSILKLIADSYQISKSSLSTVLHFYTNAPKKIAILNEASLKSVAHFTKFPNTANASFGDIFTRLHSAMSDLEHMLKMPLILALDKNHIQRDVINKTLMNIIILVAKEPTEIITSYYQMPQEIIQFIENTRMSKFHILMSQSRIRLEHLSISFYVNLLKKQTVQSLRNSILRFDHEAINHAFIESVRKIIDKSTLIDFQRIYHKSLSKKEFAKTSLISIAKDQGLTGNEFLEVYDMAGKNITEVTIFANYTFGQLEANGEHDTLSYTLKQLGEIMKEEIDDLINPKVENDRPTKSSKTNNKKTAVGDEVDAEADGSRATPKALVAIPVLLCILGTISGVLAWIYQSKKKEMRSAW